MEIPSQSECGIPILASEIPVVESTPLQNKNSKGPKCGSKKGLEQKSPSISERLHQFLTTLRAGCLSPIFCTKLKLASKVGAETPQPSRRDLLWHSSLGNYLCIQIQEWMHMPGPSLGRTALWNLEMDPCSLNTVINTYINIHTIDMFRTK